MTERKRKPKPGIPRSEVFAMRLDPKLKYLSEIAARQQRRSLANFIECAIEKALENVHLKDGLTVAQASQSLWELDFRGRLLKLAINYPELLSYDEQKTWSMAVREFLNEKIHNVPTKWPEIEESLGRMSTSECVLLRYYLENTRNQESGTSQEGAMETTIDPTDETMGLGANHGQSVQ